MENKTKNKAIGFFGISPFQIMSAINIATNRKKLSKELFIFFTIEQSKSLSIINDLKKQNLFERIYVVNREKKGLNIVYLLKTLFYPLKAIKDQISNYDENLIFDEIYCTDCNSLMCALYIYNIKLNPSIKLHLIEDGARNYCNQFDNYKNLRKCMYFFSLPLYVDNFLDTVVFEPRMLNKQLHTSLKAIEQPKFYKNKKALSITSKLYNNKIYKNEINPGDLIYFNQPFFKKNTPFLFKKIEKKVLKILKENTKNEQFKFKSHPKIIDSSSFKNLIKTSAVEPYFINEQEKLDKITFVGVSSTVLFSPKLLFDKEPTIIFLHKIFKNCFKNSKEKKDLICYIDGSFNRATEKLKELYRNKSKIVSPNTILELEDILKNS
ncbi:MAG: alpha-2,8-polysialyltransferase family protein [Oscillospiraceae bacterium]|nr:alpha-2,8-polysialyltransferase family protein [Oscillospiraceae bacterium]